MESYQRGKIDWTLVGTLGVLFFGYVLIYDIVGGTLLTHNVYDSYTLQSLAWLDGRTYLDQNYTWLELAIHDGHYFVSFPPFPSVVMLPLAMIFGENTPSNLVVVASALCSVAFCYECFRRRGAKETWAAFWAIFYVMGSNMLSMSVFGGVWYMAQGLNLALVTGALWALLCNRRGLCLALLALAVGCRPFSVCFFAAAFIWFVIRILKRGESDPWWKIVRMLVAPTIIAICYMSYNYARFQAPFEFGHSYLPEFSESENGQFNWVYIGQNAFNIFFQPVTVAQNATLEFPSFDGFMFFIANPFFLVWFAYLIRDVWRRTFHLQHALITIAFAVNLLLLLMHKTFGGWQFGARYTVDLLPYALWYLMADRVGKPPKAMVFLGAAAIMFNVYGALAMFFKIGF